jgi:undecaprenyl-diphosphatase
MPRPPDIALPLAGALLLLGGAALWALAPSLDQALLDGLRMSAGSPWAALAAGLSRIGGFSALGPVALAAIAWFVWRRRPREALWLLLAIGGGRLIVEALKLGFARPRPPASDRLATVTSWSFPSSHGAGTMLTCLALAMLFRGRGAAPMLAALAFAFAFAVGWSRIALGVHWPSDVLAGWGVAMLWIGIAWRWLNPSRFPGD